MEIATTTMRSCSTTNGPPPFGAQEGRTTTRSAGASPMPSNTACCGSTLSLANASWICRPEQGGPRGSSQGVAPP